MLFSLIFQRNGVNMLKNRFRIPKYCKMQWKSMILQGKTEFGQTRKDQVGPGRVRPGGTRGAVLCLRQGSSGRDYSGFVPLTQLSPQGAGRIQSLRAFRRAQHHQKQAWCSNFNQKCDFWQFWNFWKFIKKLIFGGFGESLGSLGVSPPTQPNTILFFGGGDFWRFCKSSKKILFEGFDPWD